MLKTESDIERDFYTFLKGSALGKGIKGAVYRSEMRPADARTEDCVVKFLTGLDTQVQTGIVVLNIYVPDIPLGKEGRKVGDKARIAQLQRLIAEFVETGGGSEYWLQTESTPRTYCEEEHRRMEQHLVAVRIRFSRLS